MFCGHLGEPLDRNNLVNRHFKPTLKRAAKELIPGDDESEVIQKKREEFSKSFRLYDLRHTCATVLLQAGINPKVVSERLGHASITMTLDTYSHVLPDMQMEASAAMQEILSSTS